MSARAMDANTIIQNFLKSMPGSQQGSQESLFTTLADLLTPASTIPFVESADTVTVDRLLAYLPPSLVSLAQEADDVLSTTTQDSTPIDSSLQAITLAQKRDILRRVLRSPQFSQSLSSLTIALRDGGLPSLSEALGIPVRNGGFMSRGGVPLGGGDAVEAFLDGVKEQVEKDETTRRNDMDTT
jgi:26S proteasome regulatory subunit N13